MEQEEEKMTASQLFNTSSKDFTTWKFDFSRYKIVRIIGAGAYGTVCEGVDLSNNQPVAIKRITNLFIYPVETKRVLREISILRQLDHPNIIKLIEVLIEGDPETFNTIYMIMEYFPSDLKRLFNSSIYLNSFQIETIMYQALQALDYLHSSQILHRDIKPANILINEECTVKLCDFGLARSIYTDNNDNSPNNNNVPKLQISSFSPKNLLSRTFGVRPPGSANNSPEKILHEQSFVPDPKLSHENLQPPKKHCDFSFLAANLEEDSPGLQANKLSPKLPCEQKIPEKPFSIKLEKPPNPKKKKNVKNLLTKHVVSRWYRPPEVILIEPSYTSAIDVWSLGCIFGELQKMLKLNMIEINDRTPMFPGTSCFPLSPEIKKENKKLVVKGNKDQLKKIFGIMGTPSERDIEFISDPNSLNYLKSFKKKEKQEFKKMFPGSNAESLDLLEKMLTFNPKERISASEGTEHGFFKKIKAKKPKVPFVKQMISLKFDKAGVGIGKKMRTFFLDEISFYKNK